MGSYKVTTGQNLYDVAMHVYGSVEGITDLLINNPVLSMATRLKAGDELIFSDDYILDENTVAYNNMHNIIPANGEQKVYFKESNYEQIAEFRTSGKRTSAAITLSGTGTMEIDWGDNTPIQSIELSIEIQTHQHTFDNVISTDRRIRLYGNFKCRQVDITALTPSSAYFLKPFETESFTLKSSRASLDFAPLLTGTYRMELAGVKAKSLLPLVECRTLMHLDLSGADILRETLDEFLIALVNQHYGRRNCEIILTDTPSGDYQEPERDELLNYKITTGMEAVWLLVNEPAWNEGGYWKIDINGTIYTHE